MRMRIVGEEPNWDCTLELRLTLDEALVGALKTIVIHGKELKLRVLPAKGAAPTKGKSGEPRDLYAVALTTYSSSISTR
jgi:hypothetical protein